MFGGGSELLMTGGAFDSTMNGHGSTRGGGGGGGGGRSSGSASSSFDLSDFPILGGSGGGGGGLLGSGNDDLAAVLRQQQQTVQAQQLVSQGDGVGEQPSSNLHRLATQLGGQAQLQRPISISADDYPALPDVLFPSQVVGGAGLSGIGAGGVQRDSSNASTPSPFAGPATPNSGASSNGGGGLGLFGVEVDGMIEKKPTLDGAIGGSGTLGNIDNTSSGAIGSRSTSASVPSSGSNPGASTLAKSRSATALNSDYGVFGLLCVIGLTEADRNALALGSDLVALGMSLNSDEKLHSTFASPFSKSPTTGEPQYQLPMCYFMQPPALKTGHLSKFQLETLFYIFYALPKDVLQAYAAQELYSRKWRYHVDLKLWFKRADTSDGLSATVNVSNQYVYFDVNTWGQRLFNGNVQALVGGLLSEDDVRVKFPSS